MWILWCLCVYHDIYVLLRCLRAYCNIYVDTTISVCVTMISMTSSHDSSKVIYTKVERVGVHFSCLHVQCGLLIAAKAAQWRRWMKISASPCLMSLDECMQARKTHAHSFYLGIDDFVTLHAFQDMPIIRQRAFHVAPGTENQIPVTPTLYTTAPQVRTEYRAGALV